MRPLTFSLVFNDTNMPDEDIFQLRVTNWRKFYEFGLSDLLSITDRCDDPVPCSIDSSATYRPTSHDIAKPWPCQAAACRRAP